MDRLTEETSAHRAVLDWIKEDAPIGLKMMMTPDLANKLSARIAHRRASQAAAAPSDGLREVLADMIALFSADGCLLKGIHLNATLGRARAALSASPEQEGNK